MHAGREGGGGEAPKEYYRKDQRCALRSGRIGVSTCPLSAIPQRHGHKKRRKLSDRAKPPAERGGGKVINVRLEKAELRTHIPQPQWSVRACEITPLGQDSVWVCSACARVCNLPVAVVVVNVAVALEVSELCGNVDAEHGSEAP